MNTSWFTLTKASVLPGRREKDIEKAEKLINEMADQGWILQQIATPDDGVGAMVGVFYKERKL